MDGLDTPCAAPLAARASAELDAWLRAEWTDLSGLDEVVRQLGQAFAKTELDPDRLALVTLPIYASQEGVQHIWERESPHDVRTVVRPPGYLDDAEHVASPLHAVFTSGTRLRAKLREDDGTERFAFLRDLANWGFTDYLATPVPTRRSTVHVLTVATRRAGGWSDGALDALERLLPPLGMLVEVWECERLLETAATDPLTTVASRRAFDAALRQAWSTCARASAPISIARFDVDHYGPFCERLGRVAGDRCLIRVAAAAASQARRGSDLLARFSAGQFALLMPASDAQGALLVAERVRAAIGSIAIPHPTSLTAKHVTVSVGVATLRPADRGARAQLVALADDTLARAKQRGGDRVEAS